MQQRIEQALERHFAPLLTESAPPRLLAAMRHSVFPGGARIRPQLCVAVARACGDDAPELTDAAAVAIELLHCASLVHDDMPAFDDADLRRGRPTVHKAYGEPLALLAGDGLIVMAFQVLARAGASHPQRLASLLGVVSDGVGAPMASWPVRRGSVNRGSIWAATSGPRRARCSLLPPVRARWRLAPIRRAGAAWVTAWVRLTRWPTISAT